MFFSDESEWGCLYCTYLNKAGLLRCEACNSAKEDIDEDTNDYENDPIDNELRIILVGRTGAGKSATGNSILGEEFFKSKVSCSSLTKNCKRGRVERRGRMVQVVDTPGLFDTEMNNDSVTKEILKCIGISAPGPHAILLVVRVGRFTDEERETVRLLQRAFGDNMTKYLLVVFTGKDSLDRESKSVSQMVQEGPKCLREFLKECDNRYFAFNNNADNETREAQVEHLLKMIDGVIMKNGGDFYKNSIFDEADKVIRERITQKENEQKIEMARLRKQKSEEYYEYDLQKRGHVDSLNRQLRLLEGEQAEEEARLHQLRTGLDNHQNDEYDNNYYKENDRIREIKERIHGIKGKLSKVKTDRESNLNSPLYRRQESIQSTQRWNPREEVRDEIERGDTAMMKKVWRNIRKAGIEVWGRFRSLFEVLKAKAGM